MRQALVLGGAATLNKDLLTAYDAGVTYSGVVACNEAGAMWPYELDAWVTLHPQLLFSGPRWWFQRVQAGYPMPEYVFTHNVRRAPVVPKELKLTSFLFPGQKKCGSSGLFAAKVALVDLKYDSVVLCGVPMTVSAHVGKDDKWKSAVGFRKSWLDIDPAYLSRMRSMSGWTKQLLGAPDESHCDQPDPGKDHPAHGNGD
jgi:hypothetical protein